MYLARLTRPDLLLPVTYLASKSHCATTEDLKKAERILYYLVYTRDLGITIRCEGLQLKCLCDASYGVHDDGRSHTGYIITLGETRSYLHARSGKQKLTATSSTDSNGGIAQDVCMDAKCNPIPKHITAANHSALSRQ